MNGKNIPNVKVLSASGLGGVISALIIDVADGRFGVTLSGVEEFSVVFFSALAAGYFMPEKKTPTVDEVIDAVRKQADG